MTTMIRTGLYHMGISGTDYEVAHLYEHLLINTFVKSLPNHGVSEYLYGWVSGETFQDIMFIEYGFYDPKVEKLFKEYMQRHSRIDFALVDNELERIQAEAKQSIRDVNRSALRKQLASLDNTDFVDHSRAVASTQPTEYSDRRAPLITFHTDKENFQQIAVVFGVANLTLDEKLVFLRLTPLLYELADSCLFDIGAYRNDASYATDKHHFEALMATSIYTIKRDTHKLSELTTLLSERLERLMHDVNAYPKQLNYFIEGYSSNPDWHTFPIDYYRWSGIITSRENISKQFTPERVVSLLSRLEVQVVPATKDHWSVMP